MDCSAYGHHRLDMGWGSFQLAEGVVSELLKLKRSKELQKQAIASAIRGRDKLQRRLAAQERLIANLKRFDWVTGQENERERAEA